MTYWDTSAVIWFYGRGRIDEISGITRTHTLAELFSALTGQGVEIEKNGRKRQIKFSPPAGAAILSHIRPRFQYVDLSSEEIEKALKSAQLKAVQGGRVHDYFHAVAAAKAQASELFTIDENDFVGLGTVPLINPAQRSA
jgi:hypothetical protein